MAAGSVYLVPVPIGNLGDITLRALETLKKVAVIACEDTRQTRFLLSRYEIPAPRLLSLHKYNEKRRSSELLELLREGHDIAVVTDAGSPGISDPAFVFVREAIDSGLTVVPLPGATALIPALTASGIDPNRFQFLGFLPLKGKDRAAALCQIRDYPGPSVIYEAPHRIRKTLEDILAACGTRSICLGRELTKLHEEFIRGELSELLADYQIKEKGEFVAVIGPGTEARAVPEEEIDAYIEAALAGGKSPRTVAAELALRFGLNRNDAYGRVLARRTDK